MRKGLSWNLPEPTSIFAMEETGLEVRQPEPNVDSDLEHSLLLWGPLPLLRNQALQPSCRRCPRPAGCPAIQPGVVIAMSSTCKVEFKKFKAINLIETAKPIR